jgi:hypothetical protein
MRALLALLALTAAAPVASAGELTADHVRKVMAEHGDEVKACYVEHGVRQPTATGRVEISLVVAKDGTTDEIAVDAPGVKGPALARCVEAAARGWSFPAIDSPTLAQLPFLFQHTHARGAGPRRGTRR